jgi:hypothetical protein
VDEKLNSPVERQVEEQENNIKGELDFVDDADVIMDDDANVLLGRKTCSASGRKLLIIDNGLTIIDLDSGCWGGWGRCGLF